MLRLSHPQKLRALLMVNLALTLSYFTTRDTASSLLAVSLAYCLGLNLVGNNVSLHRYFSHGSFVVHNSLGLKIFSTLCGLGSQISYSAIHRQHHKYSDSDQDPHNPREIGILRSLLMVYKPVDISPAIVRDLFKDSDLRFIHKHYYTLLLAWALVLLSFGFDFLVLFFCLPCLVCWVSAVSIGIVPHLQGYVVETTLDSSKNSILASILSTGEGWHNYHHAHPRSYRHGTRWWELDPAAFVIGLLDKTPKP